MLYPHQTKYVKGYKDKELVVHETGTGKTVCASVWLKDGRDSDALVVAPKRVLKKWSIELEKWHTKATIVSFEPFKKLPVKQWSALVIDEADEFASPLFTKQRSARSECLYELVKAYPDVPILLLSATPIRSSPANLHSLLVFRGVYIPWKTWRDKFYSLERRPFLPRPAWLPKPNWRKDIRPVLEKYSDIVLLKDCVSYIPPVTEQIIKVKTKPLPKNPEWEPSAAFVAEHRNEQTNKVKEILAIAKHYRKILVVAHYVEQCQTLEKELSKNRETFMMYGGIKDQESVIKSAYESDECFFVVQASLGVGFDADGFSCVVFASMSYKVRDFIQMKGRVRRRHNLHPVAYYYLLGGPRDTQVYKTILLGKDFIPSEW